MDSSLTNTTWHRRFNHASVVLRAMGSLISICLIAVALVFASVSFTNANVEAAPTASITSNPTRVSGSDRYYIPGDSITTRLQTDQLFNTHDPGMKMKIDIGGVERQAGHTDPLSSGATDKMNFSYTVVWGDCDSDGITIPANSVIGSAWFIPGRIARPTNHSALTNQSAHKVFGCRPTISTTPSTLNESNLNNAEIVVTLTGGAQFVTGAAQKRFFALNTNIRNLEIDDVKGARNGDTTATLVLKFSGDANFSTLQTLGVTVSDIARTGPGIAGGLPTPTVNVAPNDEAPSFGSNTVANQYYTALSDFRAFTFPAAHGGNGNIRYIVQGLPSGLITDLTGSGTCPGSPSRPRTICGTPSPSLNFGTYNVTIIAQDADSNQAQSDQGRLTFSINFSEASIASTNPASLTEETLDTATVNVALNGTTFGSGVTTSDFELVTAIPNVSISSLSGAAANSNTAALTLDFSGDFNTPQTLAVKVKNSAHAGNFDLTTGTVSVTPTDEPPVFDRTVLPYYFDKKSTIRPFQIPAVVGGNGAISYEVRDLPAGIDFDEDGSGSCPGTMPRMVCGKLTGSDSSYDSVFIASDEDSNQADSDKARLDVNMNFTEVDITSTSPAVLTEANLNNAEIELTLDASTTFTSSNFELVTTIPNLTIASVSESVAGGSVVTLTLGFHGDITGSETLAVKVKATANSAGADLTTDTVTVTPTPGIALSKNSIRVEEDSFGASANVDTYTVALNANPGSCNVIVVAESNNTDVEIDTDSTKQEKRLTFNSTNWSDPQTITVTAKQDADQVNDTVTLSHRNANQCSGSLYTTSLTFPSVSVEVVDDDAPGKAVLITSRPANGTHYVVGENITTRIRGLAAIASATSFPTLEMKINIGGSEQNAGVTSAFSQGMTQIDFSYEVTRNDFDTNGVSIPADSLVNANFQTSASQPVDTSHSALADQSRQKVVGSAVLISATSPASLAETNLNNATLSLSLTGTTFASGVDASSFELVSAIPDLSISQVSTVNSGDTTATLTLAFTGNISASETLAVKVKSSAHAGSVDLTSATVTVSPTDTAPVFTSIITTKILPKGTAIRSFQIPAASGGNGELSYEVRGLPSGLVFDEDGSGSCGAVRTICGTPSTAAINYNVRVTVDDADSDRARSDQARQEFIIALYGVNILSTTPSTLSALNLNNAKIRVELINTTFGRGVNASSFELVTAIPNVSVNSVSGGSVGSRTATLSLYFGGAFSGNEDLAVRVKSTAHRRSATLTTDTLTVQRAPGVNLSVNAIELREDDGASNTATYNISLDTPRAPGCDIAFDIESDNPDVRIGTASNSPTKIVGNFTSSQTYTVNLFARSDADHQDETATITHKFKNSCAPYTVSVSVPSMRVTVVDDEEPPAVAITTPALLTRSTLNGATLSLALENSTFASGVAASGFELVTGIANLSISGVVASGATATLTLSHSGTLSADRKLRVRVLASSHSGVEVLETNEIDVLLGNDTAPSFGTLVIPTKYYVKGTPIDALTIPAATGGNGDLNYSIQDLPGGLEFDEDGSGSCGAARTICGTPAAEGSSTVTLTAADADTNRANSDSAELTFMIIVPGVSITSNPAQLERSNLATATLGLVLTDTTFTSGVSTSSFELLTLIPGVTISQVSGATAGSTTATLTLAYTPGTLISEQTLAVRVKANANARSFDLTSNALTVQVPDIAPSFGSGSVTQKFYQKGQSITEFQVPVATHAGGDDLSYAVQNLPSGLVFDEDGSGICPGNEPREICGTPDESGSSSVAVVVNDEDANRAIGDQARLTFNITVYDAAITSSSPVSLTGANLNSATVGITLTGTTFGSGVTASSFELVTTIPSLSVSGVSSVNSGDTTATLTLEFTGSIASATTLAVKVLDAAHARSGDLTTGSVLVPPTSTDDTAPSFGASTVATKHFATNTSIDAFQIPAASGGNGDLTYTVTGLPGGLVFDADGNGDCSGSSPRTVCGTPTTTGSSTVVVNVHDADSNRANTDRAQISFMIAVSGVSVASTSPSSLTEANLNTAMVNLSLTGTTFGSGVNASSFELVTEIPDVSISSVSGVTSGGTTAALTLAFTGDISSSQTLSVKVLAAAHAHSFDVETSSISVAPSDEKPTFSGLVSNKDFATNTAISAFQIPAARGGNGDLTYAVAGLPSGLVFDEDGSGSCSGNTALTICGTPASAANSVVVVTVHDSDSNRASSDSDVLMFKVTVASPAAAIRSTAPAMLTETNLNNATIQVMLSQTTFNSAYTAADFELVSAIPTLSITGIRRVSTKIARLQLGFTGEFDAAQTIAVKVKASAHAHSSDLTTGMVTVTPTSELILSRSTMTLEEDPGESEANIGTYTVQLSSNPGSCTVNLEHRSSNSDVTVGSGASFSDSSISFDSTNWNTPVTVRVTAGQDADTLADTATISYRNTQSCSGTLYPTPTSGEFPPKVRVTVNDDDVAMATITSPAAFTAATLSNGQISMSLSNVAFGSGVSTSSFQLVTGITGLSISQVSSVNSGDTTATLTLSSFSGTITGTETLAVRVLNSAHTGNSDITSNALTVNSTDNAPSFASATIANKNYQQGSGITAFQIPVATGGEGTLAYELESLPAGLIFDEDGTGDCDGSNVRTVCGTPTTTGSSTVNVNVHDADSNRSDADRAQISFTIAVSSVSITSTSQTPLTESDLGGATISVELAGTSFGSGVTASSFALVTEIQNVSISGVSNVTSGDTTAVLTLAFPSGTMSSSQTLGVSVLAAAHTSGIALTSEAILVLESSVTDSAPAFGQNAASDRKFAKDTPIEAFQIAAATGGNGTITYTAANLPEGLVFDADGTGDCSGSNPRTICGTPTAYRTSSVIITAQDSDSSRVAGDTDSVTFTIEIAKPSVAVSSTSPSPLTESGLNNATLTVQLTNSSFTSPATNSNFELVTTIPSITISQVSVPNPGSTTATLTLAFTGDISTAQTLAVKVKDAAHESSLDLTSDTVAVSATDEAPSFSPALENKQFVARTSIAPFQIPTASGGNGALSYQVEDLPTGLVFDESGNGICGTALTICGSGGISERGSYTVNVIVNDADSNQETTDQARGSFTINLLDALITSTTPFPLVEDNLDNAELELTLYGTAFANGVTASSFELVTSIPSLSISSVSGATAGGTTATLTLSFTGNISTTASLAIKVKAAAHTGSSDELTTPSRGVSPTSGVAFSAQTLTLDEDPGDNTANIGTYTIALKSSPGNCSVVIEAASNNADAALDADSSPLKKRFTFDGSSWNVPQTVTVTVSRDSDGFDETSKVTHAIVAQCAGTPYISTLDIPSVSVVVNDSESVAVESSPAFFTIDTFNNSDLTLNLTGTTFTKTLSASDFQLITNIEGISILSATGASGGSTATLRLGFRGVARSDSEFKVRILAAAHAGPDNLESGDISLLVADTAPSFGTSSISNKYFAKNELITAFQIPAASGGNGTITYSVEGLPAGLVFDADGSGDCPHTPPRTICGTPADLGVSNIVVTVIDSDTNDSNSDRAQLMFDISIVEASVTSSPSQLVWSNLNNSTLSLTLTNTTFVAGVSASDFEVVSTLSGLSISGVSGVTSGGTTGTLTLSFNIRAIATLESFAIKVKPTAHAGDIDLITNAISVSPSDVSPTFGGATLSQMYFPAGNAITEFQIPAATHLTDEVSYTVQGLPAGLEFDEDGSGSCSGNDARKICGTPAAPGIYNATATAHDQDTNRSTGDSATLAIQIVVYGPTISSTSPSALLASNLNAATISLSMSSVNFVSGVTTSSFELITNIPNLSISQISGGGNGALAATLTLAFTGNITSAQTLAVKVKAAAHSRTGDITTPTVLVLPTGTSDTAPSFSSSSLTKEYSVGVPIDAFQIPAASGGNGDLDYTVVSVPQGIIYDADGSSGCPGTTPRTICGTLTRGGSNQVTVTVHDSDSNRTDSDRGQLSINMIAYRARIQSNPSSLTASNLNTATISVSMTGSTFGSGVTTSSFELITDIPSLSISQVSGATSGSSSATLTLSFSGNFSVDETLKVKIKSSAHARGNDLVSENAVTVSPSNVIPTFSSTVDNKVFPTNVEIDAFQIPAASGGNGDLDYSVAGLPSGLMFDEDGNGDCPGTTPRTICGTPDSGAIGVIVVVAHDSDLNRAPSDSARLNFFIRTTPAKVRIVSTSPATLTEANLNNATIRVALELLEFESGAGLSHFELVTAIPNMSITQVSGVTTGGTTATLTLSFTGDFSVPETLAVKLKAAAHNLENDVTSDPITVSPTDESPAFSESEEDKNYFRNVAITPFQVPAASGGNGSITYVDAGLPDGLVFDADGTGSCQGNEARTICGTPTTNGTSTVTITASDTDTNNAQADKATLTFMIRVQDAPTVTISSTPGTLSEDNLHRATIDVTLSGTVFAGSGNSRFELDTSISGLTISRVAGARPGSTTATLTLSFDEEIGNFNATQSLRVKVKDAGHLSSGDLTSNSLSVLQSNKVTISTSRMDLIANNPANSANSGTYTIVLASAPQGNVSLRLLVAQPGFDRVPTAADNITIDTNSMVGGNQNTLTFTQMNWNTPQTVKVTGRDAIGVGATSVETIVHYITSGSAPYQIGQTIDEVKVWVHPPISTPAGLSAVAGDGQATLNWTDPANRGITAYELSYRAGTSGAFTLWTTIPGSNSKSIGYTVPNLTNGIVYTVRLRTVSSGGHSGYAETTVTPSATADAMPKFTKTVPRLRYKTNSAIATVTLPAATGGNGTLTYAMASVPSGLTYTAPSTGSNHGGTITGTPTQNRGATNYALTATDTDNDVATLNVSIEVLDAPYVTGLRIGSARNYLTGEIIGLNVVFNENVRVSASGTTFLLQIGETWHQMEPVEPDSDSNEYYFEYRVTSTDWDGDGITVPRNPFRLFFDDGGHGSISRLGGNRAGAIGDIDVHRKVSFSNNNVYRVNDKTPSFPARAIGAQRYVTG